MLVFAILVGIALSQSVDDIRQCDFDEFAHDDVSLSYSTTDDLDLYQYQYGYSKGQYGKYGQYGYYKKTKIYKNVPIVQQQVQTFAKINLNNNVNDILLESNENEKEEEEEEEEEILPIWKMIMPLNVVNFTLANLADDNSQFQYDKEDDEWSNFTSIARSSFTRTIDVTSKNILQLDNWFKIDGRLLISKNDNVEFCRFNTVVRTCESYSSCNDKLVNMKELSYYRRADMTVYQIQAIDMPFDKCQAQLTLIPTSDHLRCIKKLDADPTSEWTTVYSMSSSLVTVPIVKDHRYRFTLSLLDCKQEGVNNNIDLVDYLRSPTDSYSVPECDENDKKFMIHT